MVNLYQIGFTIAYLAILLHFISLGQEQIPVQMHTKHKQQKAVKVTHFFDNYNSRRTNSSLIHQQLFVNLLIVS